MKYIEVKYNWELDNAVCVTIDGQCNHADTHDDQLETGNNGALQWETICNNCGAMYNELDDDWIVA